jgi:hypothetical protein
MMAEPTAYEMYVALQNQLVMWQLVTMFLCVLLVVGVILFMPFIPWIFSKLFTRKTVIALMDKSRNIKFNGGFQLRNGMYHHKSMPLYFVKKYPGVFYLSGVPIDICNIDLGFVQHPVYNNFIKILRDAGYKNWKSIETALELNTIPDTPEGLAMINELGYDSRDAAFKALNPLKLTEKSEILAPYFSSCCLDELIGYGADVPPASIAGEVDDVVQSQKSPEMAGLLKQYLPMGILILLILIGGAVAYAIVSKV